MPAITSSMPTFVVWNIDGWLHGLCDVAVHTAFTLTVYAVAFSRPVRVLLGVPLTSCSVVLPAPLTSTTPSIFGYEDLLCLNFSTQAGDVVSVLNGLTDVYLCGKVILDNGDEITVDEDAARMHNVSYSQYKYYFYPRSYFKVPEDRTIKNMYFWFRNADGSKVENANGALFAKPAKGTPLK